MKEIVFSLQASLDVQKSNESFRPYTYLRVCVVYCDENTRTIHVSINDEDLPNHLQGKVKLEPIDWPNDPYNKCIR